MFKVFSDKEPEKNWIGTTLIISAILFYLTIVLKNAWVTDDAYITFRTVDNFVNGYGLTWNVNERVQSYTHPLWMFLISAVYFFTHEAFYTSIFVSVAVSVAAVILFGFKIARTVPQAFLGIVVLSFSKAFIDYSTSGLENPLTHLILVAFFWVYFTWQKDDKTKIFILFLLAALGTVNRLDSILLYLPTLLFILIKTRKVANLGVALVGLLPFLLWESFSLFYYGVPFPNTAYAKLNTAIDSGDLINQGLLYTLNSLTWDPLTLIVVFGTLIISIMMFVYERHWDKLPLAAGIALYLVYTIKVGGDFMSGRFFTAILLLAIILLARYHFPGNITRHFYYAATGLVVIIGLLSPVPPMLTRADYGFDRTVLIDKHGIADEKGFYFHAASLVNAKKDLPMPNHEWARLGLAARYTGPQVVIRRAIGYYGYFAGPEVYIIDSLALTDPLLARLPAKEDWRIGHFERDIPDGYKATIETGRNQLENPQIARYYEKLSLITRGELFDMPRIRAVWYLNIGKYDYLLNN